MLKTQNNKMFFGLSARIAIIIIIIVSGITFIFTYSNINQQQKILSENLLKNTQIVASLLRESATNHIVNYDLGELRLLLANVINNPEISYCYIYDELGAILTDGTDKNQFRDEILSDPISIKSIATTATLVQIDKLTLEITEPVYLGEKKIGGVRVGVSLAKFEQEKIDIIKSNIQLTVIYIFIAILIARLISRQLTKPIHSFIQVINKINSGNDEQYSNIRSNDEIGQLSTAFDNMLLNLRKTTASKSLLDKEVSQRISTEAELRKAKTLAEQANIAKSEFLASMSHEIRTPMNGVLGMLRLLIDDELNEKQRHKATIAQSSAQSLLLLLNDILDFSKIDAGNLELQTIDFNLRTLMEDFTESMALSAQEKGLEIVLDVTNIKQSSVKGDPGRLRQILTNIVGNAIKFTENGEVVIRAELKENKSNKVILHCSIIDTGIGIPHERQIQLFGVFTQVDASTTRKYGGAGLGLSIAKKLCELMGGNINVFSELGKGSCFEFIVTFELSNQSTLVIPKVNIDKLNLLIVDDNKTNREVLTGQFEHWGAKVSSAADGPSALRILNERALDQKKPLFDMAFIDMQMPVMDGVMLSKSIKTNNHFDGIKLVMMTSMSQRGGASFFADLGFDAYFPKPATTSDLFGALAVVIDKGETLHQANPLVTQHYLQSPGGRYSSNSDTDVHEQSNSSIDAFEQKNSHNVTRGEKQSKQQWPPNIRVLLVEDNRTNQKVALAILKKIGLHADIADDGQKALDAIRNAPNDNLYTIILMDCQMPVMDGYEASRNIRAGKAGIHNQLIPIIAVTANAMKGDKDKCLEAGMSDYLTKPIDINALTVKIKTFLP